MMVCHKMKKITLVWCFGVLYLKMVKKNQSQNCHNSEAQIKSPCVIRWTPSCHLCWYENRNMLNYLLCSSMLVCHPGFLSTISTYQSEASLGWWLVSYDKKCLLQSQEIIIFWMRKYTLNLIVIFWEYLHYLEIKMSCVHQKMWLLFSAFSLCGSI